MIAKLVRRVRQLFEPIPPTPQPPAPLEPNHSETRQTEMKAQALKAMNQEATRRLYIDFEQMRAESRREPWEWLP